VQCGWLKDQYRLSWQVNPTILGEFLADQDPSKSAAGEAGDAADEEDRYRSLESVPTLGE